jgi:hypothetical protein
MSMPEHPPLSMLALCEVGMVRIDSKHAEREPPQPDLWQVTVEGYMVGTPVNFQQAVFLKDWLGEKGFALRDITNLFRESAGG